MVAMNDFYKMFGGVNWNEDGNICVHNRHIFEEQGCKFAPVEVAKDFSHESPLDINRGIIHLGITVICLVALKFLVRSTYEI